MKKIAIIWAGAAWLMTAASILENSVWGEEFTLLIFEKNAHPWKKVIISGGGRCNVTTGISDKKELLSKYTRWAQFVKYALWKFSPKKCREWFEWHGRMLVTEDDNRVFPSSHDGHDIVAVFEQIFQKFSSSLRLFFSTSVREIRFQDSQFQIDTDKGMFEVDYCVITTGWNAYTHTGSAWDGYTFARNLGHSITRLWPSLSSFLLKEEWLQELSWLVFPTASITWQDKIFSWSLLITHFGISGPLTFIVSSHAAFETISPSSPLPLFLRPIFLMGKAEWDIYLSQEFVKHPKKFLPSLLAEKLPRRFVDAFIWEYFSDIREVFAGSISRKHRDLLSDLLGRWLPLHVTERRPGDEFVTAGWIDTAFVSDESMESKILPGLYFAGEILDIDAVTGWFNLQGCWSTGYVAWLDISKKLMRFL